MLKKNLALAAIALVFLLGAAFQSSNSVSGQLNAIQSRLNDLRPREFYLTKSDVNSGAQALSACDTGYHMASLWEIHDPTNLRYNTQLGVTAGDSGFGPPVDLGWIRTGRFSSASAIPGNGNCNAWTSGAPLDNGTLAALSFRWPPPGDGEGVSVVGPWILETTSCTVANHVWCVQD